MGKRLCWIRFSILPIKSKNLAEPRRLSEPMTCRSPTKQPQARLHCIPVPFSTRLANLAFRLFVLLAIQSRIDSRKWQHSLGPGALHRVFVRGTFRGSSLHLSADEREQNARDRGVYEERFGFESAERVREAVDSRIGCFVSRSHLFVHTSTLICSGYAHRELRYPRGN